MLARTTDAVTASGVKGLRVAIAVAVLACSTAACGPVTYTVEVDDAEQMVAAARSGNAAYYAPYELYLAEAELNKAREEAANGAYEDAIELVHVAHAYAKRALELSGSQGGEFAR